MSWINIDNQLPDLGTEVLVLEDGQVQIAKYVKVEGFSRARAAEKLPQEIYYVWHDQRRFDDEEIPLMIYPTHWMPVPELLGVITFDPNPVNIDE